MERVEDQRRSAESNKDRCNLGQYTLPCEMNTYEDVCHDRLCGRNGLGVPDDVIDYKHVRLFPNSVTDLTAHEYPQTDA